MATRRTYHHHQQRNQDEAETDTPPPPPQPSGGGSILRTGLTIMVSAVIGAIAVDFYKRFFTKTRNTGDDDEQSMGMIGPMGSLPGAPSIMPMPMPLPIPWPMGGGYGFGQPVAPQGYRDERPLTDEQKLELQRLKTEEAKAKAMEAQWEAWENEDID